MSTERARCCEQANPIFEEVDRLTEMALKLDALELPPRKIVAYGGYRSLRDGVTSLEKQIPTIESPADKDQVITSELKKVLQILSLDLSIRLKEKSQGIPETFYILGLELSETEPLKEWLIKNKTRASQAESELLDLTSPASSYAIPLDAPNVVREATDFATPEFRKYAATLARMYERIFPPAKVLQGIRIEPVSGRRPYKLPGLDFIGISMRDVLLMERGRFRIDEVALIAAIGHEYLAHATQESLSSQGDVPKLMKIPHIANESGHESVALHLQRQVFTDLAQYPDIQRELGIQDRFEQILKIGQLQETHNEFERNLLYYSLAMIGENLDKFGKQEEQNRYLAALEEVALDPSQANAFARYVFGNCQYGIVSSKLFDNVAYLSPATNNVLKIFKDHGIDYNSPEGRVLIDNTLLTEVLSSKGLEDKARLAATGAWVPPQIT